MSWLETEQSITQKWEFQIAPVSVPTPEERITALEAENTELRSAIEAIVSGTTGTA